MTKDAIMIANVGAITAMKGCMLGSHLFPGKRCFGKGSARGSRNS